MKRNNIKSAPSYDRRALARKQSRRLLPRQAVIWRAVLLNSVRINHRRNARFEVPSINVLPVSDQKILAMQFITNRFVESQPEWELGRTLFNEHSLSIYKRTDQLFAWLMSAQWLAAVAI